MCLSVFTSWLLYCFFLAVEHLARAFLMSLFVAATTMIFLSPNLLGLPKALPFGLPLIRVHGALTITEIGGGSLVIHR